MHRCTLLAAPDAKFFSTVSQVLYMHAFEGEFAVTALVAERMCALLAARMLCDTRYMVP